MGEEMGWLGLGLPWGLVCLGVDVKNRKTVLFARWG